MDDWKTRITKVKPLERPANGEPEEACLVLIYPPGQDLGRVLLVVHDDKLYRLTFVPNDPTQGDVYDQMAALFAQVLRSFRFLP